jgi:predicted nucleic acid-binding protein
LTIHLDTSALVSAIVESGDAARRVRRWILDGERVTLSALVLYEWLRGPRRDEELQQQSELFAVQPVVAFGPEEAATAALLYRRLQRPRSREIDLGIAACALVHDAALWTLNPRDFADIPGLRLV